MSSRVVTPKFQASSFTCPRCHALASQEWLDIYKFGNDSDTPFQISDGKGMKWRSEPGKGAFTVSYSWSASKCYSCEKHSLWINDDLAFPSEMDVEEVDVVAPSEDLPDHVVELYKEAVAVLPHSKRAAAALCRASLERLAKHLTPDLPPDLKLDGRLVHLGKSVSSTTLRALNIVRHTGNTALHGEKDGDQSAVIYLDEDDSTIATVFFMAINALADELITKPKLMDDLYGQLPDGVRSSFEAKQQKDGGSNPPIS